MSTSKAAEYEKAKAAVAKAAAYKATAAQKPAAPASKPTAEKPSAPTAKPAAPAKKPWVHPGVSSGYVQDPKVQLKQFMAKSGAKTPDEAYRLEVAARLKDPAAAHYLAGGEGIYPERNSNTRMYLEELTQAERDKYEKDKYKTDRYVVPRDYWYGIPEKYRPTDWETPEGKTWFEPQLKEYAMTKGNTIPLPARGSQEFKDAAKKVRYSAGRWTW
jgi:hypothetical protein